MLPRKAAIQVDTDLNALGQILAWFDQFNAPPLSYDVWLECQLILIEGFTNAVRHAHKDQPANTLINIEIELFSHYIEIRVWDYGPPFDLNQKLETLPPQVDQRAEGGRGLKLMQSIADRISYTRVENQQNCLQLVKNYST